MKKSVRLIALGLLSVFLIVSYAACKQPNEPKKPDIPEIPGVTYSVTKGNTGGGDFTISPTGPYEANATVTLTITDKPANRIFDKWVIQPDSPTVTAGAAADTFTFKMPKGNQIVDLVFKTDDDIIGDWLPIVYPTVSNGQLSGVTEELEGETVTVTATPAENYEYKPGTWKIMGQNPFGGYTMDITSSVAVVIAAGTGDAVTFTFTMPDQSISVTVEFQEKGPDLGEAPEGTVYQIYNTGYLFTDMEFHGDNVQGIDKFLLWSETNFIQGDKDNDYALKFGPVLPSYGGGWAAVIGAEGDLIDLSQVDAIQFQAKASAPMKVSFFNIGTTPNRVTYSGDDNDGIPITTDWQQFYIPLPKRLNAEVRNVFNFWIPISEDGNNFYLKDIFLIETDVTLKELELQPPDPLPKTGNTPITTITAKMKAVYTLKGRDVPIYIENIGASMSDDDKTYLGFTRFYDIAYSISGTGATITPPNLVSQTAGGTYTFTVTFDPATAVEKSASIGGTVFDQNFVYIEDCMITGAVTYTWDPDYPGKFNGPADGGTSNLGYYGDGYYKAIAEHDGINTIVIMNKTWNDNSNVGTFGRDAAKASGDGVFSWDLTGLGVLKFKYKLETTGIFTQGTLNIVLGATTLAPLTLSNAAINTWTDASITIPAGQQVTGVNKYFLTFTGSPALNNGLINSIFIYISPLIAYEHN